MIEWPKVAVDDPGIRPASGPDLCHYCRARVGAEHMKDCVCVSKRVKVRYSFEIEISVPHSWGKEEVEFQRNEGTWCADNALAELESQTGSGKCLCGLFECEMLSVVDETPRVERD